MEAKHGARYIGAGNFWNGIPARDLSPDEWNAIDGETQKALVEAKIFEVDSTSTGKAKRATAESGDATATK